jgi:hypothetical protein
MLSVIQAREALLNREPTVKVEAVIVYRNVYLFRVRHASEEEADYDPFFSVDIRTGEVRDFSILTDGNINEIVALFEQAQKGIS